MTKRAALLSPAARLLTVAALLLLALVAQPRAASAQWTSSGGNTTTTDKVGVGTASPTGKLSVVGMTTADPTLNHTVLVGDDTATAVGVGGLLVFSGRADATSTQYYGSYIRAAKSNATSGNYAFDLAFGVRSHGSAPAEAMRILSNGNVGIGTTSPQKALDVHGDINVTGNINAKYQDVAEWVEAREHLAAGTVVVLDSEATNRVTTSSLAYDTKVAGVVSETPGIVLGEESASKVKVATTGRVRVKVDATNAPIRVGDLLVTSGTPGVAMKSVPVDLGGTMIHRPGTIIGKALEPLEKGTGEILVLLSLQ